MITFVLLFISILLGFIFSVRRMIKNKEINGITITSALNLVLLVILFFTA